MPDQLRLALAIAASLCFWLAILVVSHVFARDKETARPKRSTLRPWTAEPLAPVVTDRFYPCLRCGSPPDPTYLPHCRCGCGLARIEQAISTPESDDTWPGKGAA